MSHIANQLFSWVFTMSEIKLTMWITKVNSILFHLNTFYN